jgi:hypothetical protein
VNTFIPTVDANPHIEQIRGGIVTVKKEDELQRVLQPDAPQMPYRRRRGEVKSVVHWGQRKLMLSEIEFLTLYGQEGITVLYAGAAPGTHIPFLSELFPKVNFVLIDPSDFNIKETDRIVIRKEFMTDDIAREFADRRTLLISDIRSADFKVLNNEEIEKAVKRDMDWQMQWHLIMKPVAGMHKFRLPWQEGLTEYLDGEIYLPVWGPQTTTEARLIATSCNTRMWNNKVYEEQMFYFNNVTRCCLYHHNISAKGLDHCYDCSSEVHVLKKYLQKHCDYHFSVRELSVLPATDVNIKIASFVNQLTVECGGRHDGRNLMNWQKRFGANLVDVVKEFDTDNLKVVKFSPQEAKSSANVLRLQNANAAKILQHCWEVSQTKKLTASSGQVFNGWCGLTEVVMEDIGWNGGKSSSIGGTQIPVKTAADAWLWGVLRELSGSVEPWTQPPFVDSPQTTTGKEAERKRNITPSNNDKESAVVSLEDKAVTDSEDTGSQSDREDEQLHASLFLPDTDKVDLFNRIWQDVQVDQQALKPRGNHPFHKVLILLGNSGSAYIFCPDLLGCSVSKFQMPAVNREEHHLTILVGLMNFMHIDQPKSLHLLSFYAVNGTKVTSWSHAEQKDKLSAFLKTDFNFESAARSLVLNMNGFHSIEAI